MSNETSNSSNVRPSTQEEINDMNSELNTENSHIEIAQSYQTLLKLLDLSSAMSGCSYSESQALDQLAVRNKHVAELMEAANQKNYGLSTTLEFVNFVLLWAGRLEQASKKLKDEAKGSW